MIFLPKQDKWVWIAKALFMVLSFTFPVHFMWPILAIYTVIAVHSVLMVRRQKSLLSYLVTGYSVWVIVVPVLFLLGELLIQHD